MINSYKISDYLDSLCPGNSDLIEEIRTDALRRNMPIIRRDSEVLLKTLLKIKEPKSILEIGTNVGYSAIVMASVTGGNVCISTIEIGQADYEMAVKNVERAGYADRIHCILGDAGVVLKEMAGDVEADGGNAYEGNAAGRFDFIFMDAAKAQYIKWLPDIERIIAPGGVLVSDNVLHDGDIAESRFAVERRDRTTHARMREYLNELSHSPKWMTSTINVGDGMSVSVRTV